MTINLPEILVANLTAICLAAFLLLARIENKESRQLGEKLYDGLILMTMICAFSEIISFVIDGVVFPGAVLLQHIVSIVPVLGSNIVGFLWLCYTHFKLFGTFRQMRTRLLLFSLPMLITLVLIVINIFSPGILFSVSEQNVYQRGTLSLVPFILLSGYLAGSMVLSIMAQKRGRSILFFPVHLLVVPCIVGMLVQGCFYGIATGWLSMAVALTFLSAQKQRHASLIDPLSGLYNREFFHLSLSSIKEPLWGIMLDLNRFKAINDDYGHAVGDDAIREVARILAATASDRDIITRFAGDEFIVLIQTDNEGPVKRRIADIQHGVEGFNVSTKHPFELSLSIGSACFDACGRDQDVFLQTMDHAMYADKKAYYERTGQERRRH